MWQKKLKELEVSRGRISQTLGDGIHTGSISDKTGNEAATIADIKRVIDGLLTQIQLARLEVYKHIATVDDSQLRQIIQFRCIDCMTWVQVGNHMDIPSDTARMIFNRAYPN